VLAREAGAAGDVPVGALVVRDGTVLARARNRVEADRDPTAHAERLALSAAALAAGTVRLPGATLYSTIEPCFLCAGAMILARVDRLVFGARDAKFGACGSLADLGRDRRLNHRLEVVEGVLAEECAALLRDFFAARRRRAGGGRGGSLE
jgi:tRNA(adenine34) deaminase